MTALPKQKPSWIVKLTGIVQTAIAGLLVKLVIMIGTIHEDIKVLQQSQIDNRIRFDAQELKINNIELNNYDFNGRLKTVEEWLQIQNQKNK